MTIRNRNPHDDARSLARRDFIKAAAFAAAGLAGTGQVSTAMARGRSHDPERVRHFIRDVKKARLFDLTSDWDENSPIAGVNPPYSMELNATHGTPSPENPTGTRGTFGDGGQLSYTSEVQHWSGQHGAP